jgi:hypothetical protein
LETKKKIIFWFLAGRRKKKVIFSNKFEQKLSVLLIIILCYEHARDQGTLGSVAGRRHSRTPGRKGLAVPLSVGDGR